MHTYIIHIHYVNELIMGPGRVTPRFSDFDLPDESEKSRSVSCREGDYLAATGWQRERPLLMNPKKRLVCHGLLGKVNET